MSSGVPAPGSSPSSGNRITAMDPLVSEDVVSYRLDLGTSGLRGDIDEFRAVLDHHDRRGHAAGIGTGIGGSEYVRGVAEARNRGGSRVLICGLTFRDALQCAGRGPRRWSEQTHQVGARCWVSVATVHSSRGAGCFGRRIGGSRCCGDLRRCWAGCGDSAR